jgi:hypothetical protein
MERGEYAKLSHEIDQLGAKVADLKEVTSKVIDAMQDSFKLLIELETDYLQKYIVKRAGEIVPPAARATISDTQVEDLVDILIKGDKKSQGIIQELDKVREKLEEASKRLKEID